MDDFETLRPTLFAIAYNMLGSVMEAEDIVQDAYLRFQAIDPQTIRSPRAFLKTMVTRLCLDALKSARMQREQYIGPWLPEPVLTDSTEQRISREETVSVAFLTIMEELSPAERAVFLLREVFDYDYADIASTLDRSEVACRKLYSRAKQQLLAHRPSLDVAPPTPRPVLERFLTALNTGDTPGLLNVLADEVTFVSDGGGKVPAAMRPLSGRAAVAKFFTKLVRLGAEQGHYRVVLAEVNGAPGFFIQDEAAGRIDSVFTFDISGDQIRAIHAIRNPDKLRHLG